jgi:hypothetical protein
MLEIKRTKAKAIIGEAGQAGGPAVTGEDHLDV